MQTVPTAFLTDQTNYICISVFCIFKKNNNNSSVHTFNKLLLAVLHVFASGCVYGIPAVLFHCCLYLLRGKLIVIVCVFTACGRTLGKHIQPEEAH